MKNRPLRNGQAKPLAQKRQWQDELASGNYEATWTLIATLAPFSWR